MSCQFVPLADPSSEDGGSQSEKVRLGATVDNPFSLVRARAVDPAVEANRLYLRVRTQDPEKLAAFMAAHPEAQAIPLDREIVEGGVDYDDPEVDETAEIGWLYLVVVPSESAALQEQGYEVEVLEPMYVDEATLAEVAQSETRGGFGDGARIFGSTREKAYGRVYVWNTIVGEYQPLANAKVVTSQWFIDDSDMTDSSGYFKVGTTYDSFWGKVRIKVVFDNGQAVINRNVTENTFQYLGASEYVAGDFSVSAIDGKNIYLKGDSLQARLGTTLKAVGEYRQIAAANAVTLPPKLKVVTYIGPGDPVEGSAVMLGHSTKEFFSLYTDGDKGGGVVADILGFFGFGLIFDVIRSELPDLTINIANFPASPTEQISRTVYHEMAHASHLWATDHGYNGLWWYNYYWMLGAISQGKNYSEAPVTELVESWAFFMGDYAMGLLYPQGTVYPDGEGVYRDGWSFLDDETNSEKKESFFFDLVDPQTTQEFTWDRVSIPLAVVFNPLKDDSIRGLAAYRDELATVLETDVQSSLNTLYAHYFPGATP